MPTNDFKPFAIGGGANVETQAAWAAESTLLPNGFTAGIAPSAKANKAWRQATVPAAAISQYMMAVTSEDILDDGILNNYVRQFWSALLLGRSFTDIGVVNAWLTASPIGLVFPAPTVGLGVNLKVANSVTGAVTFNWAGTGNKPVVYTNSTPIVSGDVPAGTEVSLIYDGTNWQLVSYVIDANRRLAQEAAVLFNVQAYTTPGSVTWTVPTHITAARFKLWGGGGGGGGVDCTGSVWAGASGGGAGAYGEVVLKVTPGNSITFSVGAGGAGGAIGANGTAGGSTSFTYGGSYSAGGGTGGIGAAPGTATNSVSGGFPTGNFTFSSNGQNSFGAQLGYRGSGAPAPNILPYGGAGGSAFAGGWGGSFGTATGSNGGAPGGGGAGSADVGATSRIGGPGGDGRVLIEFYG